MKISFQIQTVDHETAPSHAQQFGFGNFMGVSYVYKSITRKGAEPPGGGMTRSVTRRHGRLYMTLRGFQGGGAPLAAGWSVAPPDAMGVSM